MRRDGRFRDSNTWLIAGIPLFAFLCLPIIALALTGSFPSALSQLKGPEAKQAIRLSISTTLISTLIIGILGLPLALWLARGNRWWHRVVETFAELPVALPPAAAGVALLIAFGRHGWFNLNLSFTTAAVVAAQVFVASPFFLRGAVSAFADQSPEMFEVAAIDGANSWVRFTKLALPMSSRPLWSALMIAWARAAGEFGATIIFAGNFPGRTQTMPLAIYLGFETNFQQALALALLLILVAVFGLGAAQLFSLSSRANW